MRAKGGGWWWCRCADAAGTFNAQHAHTQNAGGSDGSGQTDEGRETPRERERARVRVSDAAEMGAARSSSRERRGEREWEGWGGGNLLHSQHATDYVYNALSCVYMCLCVMRAWA